MWRRCAAVLLFLASSVACELPAASPALDVPVVAKAAPVAPTGPVVCGMAPVVTGPRDGELRAIAERARLEYPEAFMSVANTLHQSGRLPDCYRSKRDAGKAGWDRGDDLWRTQAGAAIGGDNFYNREGRLPKDGRYVEADIDFDGGKRGARRLVFDRDVKGSWKIWLTVDHYDSFVSLEKP